VLNCDRVGLLRLDYTSLLLGPRLVS
jgi:hypothetical protein